MSQRMVRQIQRLCRIGFLSICPHMVVTKGSQARARAGHLSKALRPKEGTSLPQRLWAYRHGFMPDELALYGLTGENIGQYVAGLPYRQKHPLNGLYSRLIDNKLFLPFDLGQWPDVTPGYYFLLQNNDIVPLSGAPACHQGGKVSLEDLLDTCREKGEVVFKPVAGSGGRGVMRLLYRDGAWHMNGDRMSDSAVKAHLATLQDYLVTECLQQHEYAAHIFPESVNTIRVLTMRDYTRGEQFIACAVQRFGTMPSRPVDNWCSGGICCRVDLETGRLGRAVSKSHEKWHKEHPETNAPIEGVLVPHWTDVANRIRAMADVLAFIPYMGWDILITEEGFKVLEINSLSDLDLLQVHGPLLGDSRVREFYVRHGVLR